VNDRSRPNGAAPETTARQSYASVPDAPGPPAETTLAAAVVHPHADAADRRRQRIKLLLETMIQNRGKVLDLITEASENHDHIALGFKSWADYVRTEYAGLLTRLTVEDRRETVLILSRTGLSTRAIAPIVGTNQSTIARDLQAGDAYASPADEQEIPQYARSQEAFVEHFGMRPDEADALISSGLVTNRKEFDEIADKIRDDPTPERTVTGLDGKAYPRPAAPSKPKRRALPAAWCDALYQLERNADRLVRLAADDRFPAHRAGLARRSPELARISEKLEEARQALAAERGPR